MIPKRPTRRVLFGVVGVALLAASLAAARGAQATFPGANGKIVFSTDQDANGNVNIFTVNPNGSGQTQLTHGEFGHAMHPAWSADGTKIVFAGDVSGSSQLYVMNADGSGSHVVFADPANNDILPAFSPDGSKIAYASCGQSGGCTIDVVNANGAGSPAPLTSPVWNALSPSWSPDGSKIAFESTQDGLLDAVWVMNADGSHQARLTAPALEAGYPTWSPDGKRLLFQDLCCLFGTNIWVMNADGSGQKQLTHMPTKHQDGFAHFSPDGKKIVLIADLNYRDNCCSDLYTMDANGTHMTAIVRDQPGVFISDWGTHQ